MTEAAEMELAELMAESPVGENHGRKVLPIRVTSDFRDDERRSEEDAEFAEDLPRPKRPSRSLSQADHEAREDRGVEGILDGEEYYHGMVAHRGVLTEDEFETLDWSVAADKIAQDLGFESASALNAVYQAAGRPSASRLAERAKGDEQLLRVKEQGGNMHLIAVALGWFVETTPTGVKCRTMSKALARAKAQRTERDAQEAA